MRVLVAGASGAIGMPLVRMLREAGHEVLAIHRAPSGRDRLTAAGAVPVQANVLDGRALAVALKGERADAVISQLTALKKTPGRHWHMAATNQLRVAGTANLLAAAQQVGARRFVTQSVVFGYGFGDWDGRVLTEADWFAPPGRGQFEEHLAALRACESAALQTAGIDGIALRYGLFYGRGPATRWSPRCATAASRWCAAPGSSRGCMSMTLPRRRSPRWSAAPPGPPTTSPTTSRPAWPPCRSRWPRQSGRPGH